MPGKLDLTARQVTAICKGAAKAGFVAEVVIGGIVVRLVLRTLMLRLLSLPSGQGCAARIEAA